MKKKIKIKYKFLIRKFSYISISEIIRFDGK